VAAASGEKALESLALILTTIEARLPAESKLLIKGVRGKINAQGEIQDAGTIH
jgi:chromate reductase